jgi:Protein of unknown function (DUF5132)
MEDEMALSWKGTVAAMLAGGALGVFLAPLIRPAIARNARPALKAAVHAGLLVYQQGRETFSEFGEVLEDVAAELKAERNVEGIAERNGREARAASVSGARRQ